MKLVEILAGAILVTVGLFVVWFWTVVLSVVFS